MVAPTLIATPGSATANSYVTLADATAFLAERLHTEPWFTLPTPPTVEDATWRNSAALIWATQLLDTLVDWDGEPATLTQALGWPRTDVYDPWDRLMDDATVPAVIQRATTYYALALLRDTSEAPTTSEANVRVRELGHTRVEYFQPGSVAQGVPQTRLPVEVERLVRPYGTVRGGITVPLKRV
jgi:hypothetical protein